MRTRVNNRNTEAQKEIHFQEVILSEVGILTSSVTDLQRLFIAVSVSVGLRQIVELQF